jgi:dihydrofolate reductase
MPKLRVHAMSMSLDGYVAGPDQDLEHPLGVGGPRLHEWIFETRTGREMIGEAGGTTGVDDDFLAAGFDGIGAWVMGRNMFGPVRGDWGTEDWKGWWGDEPPYHCDAFVLTHHARPPVEMDGGTTFHFVTSGIEDALARAFTAADGADVRLGGGAATVREYLRAGLVDDLHVAIAPVLLGGGERIFDADAGVAGGYECVGLVPGASVVHALLTRRGEEGQAP